MILQQNKKYIFVNIIMNLVIMKIKCIAARSIKFLLLMGHVEQIFDQCDIVYNFRPVNVCNLKYIFCNFFLLVM